jgi:acyl carrier protein
MNERIKRIMAKAFETPVENINANSSQDNIETWDSLHHIKMIIFLEREFDITIPDEKVGNMINYKLIELIVNECTKS